MDYTLIRIQANFVFTLVLSLLRFSNPLEVIKTRMQLQGELKAAGTYTRQVIYIDGLMRLLSKNLKGGK